MNPHPVYSAEWFAWKEQNESYLPYHVGAGRCSMPRVFLAEPDVYQCPDCGQQFPTFTAELKTPKGVSP